MDTILEETRFRKVRRVVRITDARGILYLTNECDANGNITSLKDAQGQFTVMEHDLTINKLTRLMAGVHIKRGGATPTTFAVTDAGENFFIPDMPTGANALLVDGSPANTPEKSRVDCCLSNLS